MDFGAASEDYARHRAGFPPSFFARVRLSGRVLDLGSGTGSLARGFARQGARVVALDVSRAMLQRAADLPARVAARAERCPFTDGAFDAVTAGQCWHWFDGPAVAREAYRLLRPGGRLVIAHFDYLVTTEGLAAATERLILREDPRWAFAGGDGRHEGWRPHLEQAGFVELASFDYDEAVAYTREGWAGRMRACNGVLGLDADRRASFEAALAGLLAGYPEPLSVPHRVFALAGRRPA